MNLFTLTIVNTEGFDDGKESDTHVYGSLEMFLKNAFELYTETWEKLRKDKEIEEEDGVVVDKNGTGFLTKEKFAIEILTCGYILIQLYDYHIQFEYTAHKLP